jgi:geranylgeranyl reductase family protein
MHDVAVVGAGPAGAWAAYQLARRGARVVVFDHSHPREKPCGGGVTGRALALVADVVRNGAPSVRIGAARFVDSTKRTSAVVPLAARDGGEALVVSSRTAFDSALLAAACAAGASLVSARVTAVERTNRGLVVTTTDQRRHPAWKVIGADGANSLVRRNLHGAPFTRAQQSIATGFYAQGVTSDEIVIELLSHPPGYFWSFPRIDHLAIGVCAAADAGITSASLRERTASWIRATGIGAGAPLRGYAWPIPTLTERDLTTLPTAGEGWCLIGDAAGLVDPITREGIFYALLSATAAAEAMSGTADAARHYTSRVRDELVPELARAARLKERFFRPRFAALLMEALQESAAIRGLMAGLIAGSLSYRNLKWRLASTFELGLALRALWGEAVSTSGRS